MGKFNDVSTSIISLPTTLVNELGVDSKIVLNPSFRLTNLPKDLKWTDEYTSNMRILEGVYDSYSFIKKHSLLIKKDGTLLKSFQQFNRLSGLLEEYTTFYLLGENDELVMDTLQFNSFDEHKSNTAEINRKKYDQFGILTSKRYAKAISKNNELGYSGMPNELISLDTNDDLKSLNKTFQNNDCYMDINSYELTRMKNYIELARLGMVDLYGEIEFRYVPLYRIDGGSIETMSFYDLEKREFSEYLSTSNIKLDEIKKLVLAKESLEKLIRSQELKSIDDESAFEIESMLHKASHRLRKTL